MSGVFFIALRRLRMPLVVMICIMAVATAGLTLLPGVDADGRPVFLTPFQAFYFVSYTATTIGFGEIPFAFTDRQRLWVTIIIYSSVVGWALLVGRLLALVQDKGFRRAIVSARFGRAVRFLREPFYIVCGIGETGLMVVRSLDARGQRFVILDQDEQRIEELDLEELTADPPALAADARSPETLIAAGLLKPECRGVLALCNDDQVNLAIAITVRLLRPGLRAICRSQSPETTAAMETVGTYEVINPFREFGERLVLAMKAPDTHRLMTWMTGPPGADLTPRIPAPPGHWVVCGYGRFGSEVTAAIKAGGFEVTIVDPDMEGAEGLPGVPGYGTDRDVLARADIAHAAGIVAGTDIDTANLTIAIAAREMCSGLFVIARQNLISNRLLFDALGANMTMVQSQVIADECLAVLRTPLLADFLRIARSQPDTWAATVVERLRRSLGEHSPEFWSVTLSNEHAPGLIDVMSRFGVRAKLSDLRRQLTDRSLATKSVALLLRRGADTVVLPDENCELQTDDSLLFAGTVQAERDLSHLMRNANVAEYVVTGHEVLGGAVWRWFRSAPVVQAKLNAP
jgi:voltage-gated potassium channel